MLYYTMGFVLKSEYIALDFGSTYILFDYGFIINKLKK